MLKKQNRLTKKKAFDRLFQNSQAKYYGNLIGVRLVANDLSYNRVGFMISKRLCRLAVGRNLIRRRLAAMVRQDLPQLKPGYDIVILLLAKQPSADFAELRRELSESWKRLRLRV